MIFYKIELTWLEKETEDPWKDLRLFVFINHTSMYEILFFGKMPNHFLWRASAKIVVPGADITLKRRVVGRFYKWLSPKMISITRKRDQTWDDFLNQIEDDSIIVIFPEGRLMAKNGLDHSGKPMNIRGGIADVLKMAKKGKMIIAYSEGLHHVQVWGQWIPKVFKRIAIKLEVLQIEDYINQFSTENEKQFKKSVIEDLENRKSKYCPSNKVCP